MGWRERRQRPGIRTGACQPQPRSSPGGPGNSSVPWPGRPLRPAAAGVSARLSAGRRPTVSAARFSSQLRAGDGAGQHNRCPRLGQRDRVFGDTAPGGQRGQRRRWPARHSQPPIGDRLPDQDRPPRRGGFGRGRACRWLQEVPPERRPDQTRGYVWGAPNKPFCRHHWHNVRRQPARNQADRARMARSACYEV